MPSSVVVVVEISGVTSGRNRERRRAAEGGKDAPVDHVDSSKWMTIYYDLLNSKFVINDKGPDNTRQVKADIQLQAIIIT